MTIALLFAEGVSLWLTRRLLRRVRRTAAGPPAPLQRAHALGRYVAAHRFVTRGDHRRLGDRAVERAGERVLNWNLFALPAITAAAAIAWVSLGL